MKIVLGSGPTSSDCMFIGEAPGREEARVGKPFVGASGKHQRKCLEQVGLNVDSFFLTNIVKVYQEGNPDPSPQQIADWTPTLLEELDTVRPRLIVAVGRYAAQFFLGESCPPLEVIHGIPHLSTRRDLPESVRDSIILPIYHPASALWALQTKDYIKRSLVKWDYAQVALTLDKIRKGKKVHIRKDRWSGIEDYLDLSGVEVAKMFRGIECPEVIGLDTEGIPSNPWSIQLSMIPGSGFILRTSREDFSFGILAIRDFLSRNRPIIAMHQASTPKCACYDVVMCRAMGLELQGLPWFDTMYNAYLYRLESQSNKTLCERWQGMEMEDYESLIGDIGRDKQIAYLNRAYTSSYSWDKPLPIRSKENDGTYSTRQPQRIATSIASIVRDINEGKETKDGPTNPSARWNKLRESNPAQSREIERALGPMPEGTLDDLPLDKAVFYACHDSDGSLRNAITFMSRNTPAESTLMSDGMKFLSIVERMQAAGMPVSRSYFRSLHSELETELDALNVRISNCYWEGEPFNPCSDKQVATLLRRRGLSPLKRTETGRASTSKSSIEYLRYTDDAISDIFDFRERQHNRDTYCNDVLSRIPENHLSDIYTIHTNYKSTTVTTRRLSSINPNILAIPTRTDLGRKIREGYVAPKGKIFAAYDLSGVEMRAFAHLSRDPLLCKVFRDGIHPHRQTASKLFNVPISDVTDEQKAVGKTTNFLTIYGGGYKKLYEGLRAEGITEFDLTTCKRFLSLFFETYPGVASYRKNVIVECKATEVVYDHWSMPRYLPAINCGDRELEGDEERAAVAHKVSGLAQGMIQKSMIWLDPHIDSLILSGDLDPLAWHMQVHDELVFLINEGEEEVLEPLVMLALTKHCGIELIVPVDAEAHYGYTWAECK